MASKDRRAAARRKAWGRGPMILRFEPLEGRQLLSTAADATATTTAIAPATGEGSAISSDVVDVQAPASDDVAASSSGLGDGGQGLDGDPILYALSSGTNATPISAPADPPASGTSQGLPDLTLDAFGTLHNLDWGQPFRAQGRVRNLGTAAAPAGVKVDIYASVTPTFGPQAVYVGTASVPTAIAPGETGDFDAAMIAPPLPLAGLGSAPSYYFLARVDPDNLIVESNEANNGGAPADPTSVVTITPKLNAKLEGTAFLVSPTTTTWGKTITVSAQLTNVVPGTVAPPTRARIVLSPRSEGANGPHAVTIGELSVPQLAAYPPADLQATIKLPDTPPAPLAGLTSFNVSLVPDADYVTSTPLSLFLGHGRGRDQDLLTILPGASTPAPARADVTVVRLQPATDTVTWGQPLQVSATVQNDGAAESGPLRVRFLLVDANRPTAPPLALSDAVLGSLPAGYKQDLTQTMPLEGALPQGVDPAAIAPRVIVQVDPENRIDETNEANNLLVSGPVKFALITKEGTRADVPRNPGPVTTPGDSTTTTPPTPGPRSPATPQPAVDPQSRLALRRWKMHQAHEARQAAMQKRRAISPRLRVERPRLRVAPGTVRILPWHRGTAQA
jgi:hypothetical protein